ncbi:hypothetical protein SUGI_0457530 [Cryptomeria japonica]|nr:hypothetical protein SUGI_0457530 [Cryptomeria japonica]
MDQNGDESSHIIFPHKGKGVFQRKVTLDNQTIVGSMLRLDVTAFNVAERSWDVINQPKHFCHGKLTGYYGNVILVDNKDLSLWKLNEDVKEKGQRNPQVSVGLSYNHSQVVVNSCGRILVYLYQKKLVVVDAEGRAMRSIEAKALKEKISYNVELKTQIYQVQSQLVAVARDDNRSPLKTMKLIAEELVLDTLEEK